MKTLELLALRFLRLMEPVHRQPHVFVAAILSGAIAYLLVSHMR